MKRFLSTTALVLVLGTVGVSCDKIKPPLPELKSEAPASVESSAEQEHRKTFMQTTQKDLDELRGVIAGLKTKALTAGVQSKEKLLEEAKKLETGLSEAQQHFEKLKPATRESWTQMKETFKTSLDKLKGAVKGAAEASA